MGRSRPATIGPIVERATLRAMARVVRREPAVRALSVEPAVDSAHAVHRLRVAVRKLRVLLAAFGPYLDPDFSGPLRGRLSELSDALAAVRDLDVQLVGLDWETTASAAFAMDVEPFLGLLRSDRADALRRLEDRLAAPEHAALMADLRADRVPVRHGDVRARRALRRRLRKAWRRTRDRVATAEAGSGSLHEVRKSVKRLRYLAEIATDPIGRPAKRLATQAERTQELLGAHQDAVVLDRMVRSYVAEATGLPPATMFALGELIGRAQERRRRIEQDWPHRRDRLTHRARQLLD
ncbi:CHAD domain-containing protein [Occultella gossypii]|uniref:CHAD domain-containing protein n=1 Tax=Occultella gossypii TaxID=2800820 RepID=A0ABS7SHE2_9MICO|nr:CHAD domain-containing protein [Occultella gossypii]MBZ2198701.1 CHAD domain-containing protein [Occultella gossypii]